MTRSVLLCTKRDDNCREAVKVARSFFGESLFVCSEGNLREVFRRVVPSVLLSFRCPWIIPGDLLKQVDLALNWHPGSSRYPGIGCYNFALYEDAETYGSVCHYMLPKVDSGSIIDERTFSLKPNETVASLKARTLEVMLVQFQDILKLIKNGDSLPSVKRSWEREPFTRQQLDALTRLSPDMSHDEMARRIRATLYPGYPRPYLELNGFAFEFKSPLP